MKKTFSALAATGILGTGLALLGMQTASADTTSEAIASLGLLDSIASATIENTDCSTLHTGLKLLDDNTEIVLLEENTTRSQLSRNLQSLVSKDLSGAGALALPIVKYSAATADRALECGIVKPDPTSTIPGFEMSSKLLDFAPLLTQFIPQPVTTAQPAASQ